MKKFNPNKNIIIALIVAIIVVTTISISAAKRAEEGKSNIFQVVINDTVGFFDKVISAPGHALHSGVTSVNNLFNTYDENEKLKAKIDNHDTVVRDNASKEKEIAALKKELSLDDTLTSYDTVVGNVITRSPDSWQDTLVVDQGSTDGIKENMSVMSQAGLVGRVVEVSRHSSKVELLTTENQSSDQFPVQIVSADGNSFGLLKNYDKEKQALVVTQVNGTSTIKKDDVVQTSGLGGNSPAGLGVGKVLEVKTSSDGLEREVYVQPYAQMYDIKVVTIIERLAEVSDD